MSPVGRIKKLKHAARLLHELQADANRHTKAWYPIFTKAGGNPASFVIQLNAWINGLSRLADGAVDVQRAKEERKREGAL